jgi:hypothetical protein
MATLGSPGPFTPIASWESMVSPPHHASLAAVHVSWVSWQAEAFGLGVMSTMQ